METSQKHARWQIAGLIYLCPVEITMRSRRACHGTIELHVCRIVFWSLGDSTQVHEE